MRIRLVFLPLLFASLLMGCAQQYPSGTHRKKYRDLNDFRMESPARQSCEPMEEMVSITEPDGVVTLGQILALTVMYHPELKAYSLETRAAQARQWQAGLWPNPEIDVEVENIGGTGERGGFDAAETTIQLSQLIELGDRSRQRKKIASFETELAHLDYQNKRCDIFSDAEKAFIRVLEAQEALQLSNELLKLAEESFETVKKRVDVGKDSPVETTRASVAMAHIRISHRETQRNLEHSKKQLALFWGQDKPLFKQAAGDLDSVEPLPTLEELTHRLKQTPEYARWQAEIQKSRAVLDLEKSRAMGDITIGAGLKRFNDADDNTAVLGVSIPLPLFDQNQHAKQEATYNVAKSKQVQKAEWLKLQSEFNHAYQEFANSYSRATSLKNDVLPGAMEMFNAATTAYQQGKIDYLNLLDAQRTLFDVKNEYMKSLAACHTARTDIERYIAVKNETANASESEQ